MKIIDLIGGIIMGLFEGIKNLFKKKVQVPNENDMTMEEKKFNTEKRIESDMINDLYRCNNKELQDIE